MFCGEHMHELGDLDMKKKAAIHNGSKGPSSVKNYKPVGYTSKDGGQFAIIILYFLSQ
jgi:hypothetical protein